MIRKLFLWGVMTVALASCATPEMNRPDPVSGEDYLTEVETLKAEVKRRPKSVEHRTRLARMEVHATRYFYQSGREMESDGLLEQALLEYQKGLLVSPRSEKLAQAIASILVRIEAERYYADGLRSMDLDRMEEANKAFLSALQLMPDHSGAEEGLRVVLRDEASSPDTLGSSETVTLSFQRADVRAVYEFLGKAFGLNVLFDEGVKNTPVTLFADGVTVKQALELLTATSETFFKQIGPNTLLVAEESAQKRAQYDEFVIRTFYLRIIPAKDMAAIIKGVLNPKQMIVSDQLNSIMVRDTEDVIGLVDNIIANNDLRPAELILDVEILEINRSKVEQLGIDYGSRISVNFPQNEASISNALSGGTYTLPAVSLQYLKQDIDARTLANPKVRVVHGNAAKIHIGDRIPLRSSTIQDVTGQVRTTYEYRDVGIRLAVEPHVHLDNSVSVKLGLEVSSLGQNLGTQAEPAFSIGTRNAETQMLLRDGETAVLGGLIRDEDRNSTTRLPGIGSIPLVGRLFRVDDKSAGTTDVLLTITPQIVRAWELPERDAREIYSGTERRYSRARPFAEMAVVVDGRMPPVISVADDASGEERDADVNGVSTLISTQAAQDGVEALLPSASPEPAGPSNADGGGPQLVFGNALYKAAVGQDVSVDVLYRGPATAGPLELHVLYNPRIVELATAGAGMLDAKVINEGTALVTLPALDRAADNTVIGKLVLRSVSTGTSYLAYRIPQEEGDSPNGLQTTSARIQIE